MHNLQFNKTAASTSLLKFLLAQHYIINELHRLEESIPWKVAEKPLMIVYSYRIPLHLSPDLYIHSILDYAYYQDGTDLKDTLLGIGLGIGPILKTGY
jgi:hypothetical protein